jgi:hypothetical protein
MNTITIQLQLHLYLHVSMRGTPSQILQYSITIVYNDLSEIRSEKSYLNQGDFKITNFMLQGLS